MRRVAILSVLAASAALAGCSSSDDPSGAEPLAEGLTVLQADPGTVALAYRSGEVVIYLEALRGRPTDDVYQQDSHSPKYEIDARFTDDQGYTFYSRQGGDEWLDPSWPAQLDRQSDEHPASASNAQLFQMAGDAAGVMQAEIEAQVGADRAAEIAPEIEALVGFARQAPALYREHRERLDQHRLEVGLGVIDESGDVVYGTNGPEDSAYSYGASYYYIELHDAGIDSTLGLGRHSATSLFSWAGYWLHVHDACNHGSCASSMGRKCFLQYYEAVQDYHPYWTVNHCSTGYSAFSDGGGHNCHDDSRVQMNNFVYNSAVSGTQYWCNGSDDDTDISSWPGDHSGSPECDGRTTEGYNFPAYCNYNWGDTYSCPASWQGTNDGCDCGCVFPDGTHGDPDCHP